MAEVIVLPVVRIERAPDEGVVIADGVAATVTDINAFRYARARRAVERRQMQSLLPCDCGDG